MSDTTSAILLFLASGLAAGGMRLVRQPMYGALALGLAVLLFGLGITVLIG